MTQRMTKHNKDLIIKTHKFLKNNGVLSYKLTEHCPMIDLICKYKDKVVMFKIVTDKKEQVTLEMNDLTKLFMHSYFIIRNQVEALNKFKSREKKEQKKNVNNLLSNHFEKHKLDESFYNFIHSKPREK